MRTGLCSARVILIINIDVLIHARRFDAEMMFDQMIDRMHLVYMELCIVAMLTSSSIEFGLAIELVRLHGKMISSAYLTPHCTSKDNGWD